MQFEWKNLFVIFESSDIIKQLPDETNKYKSVDRYIADLITSIKSTPSVLKVCQNEGLIARLKDCNNQLLQVKNELSLYLDFKRQQMPIFYFVSNSDLLSLIAQGKNPQAIQGLI